MVSVTSRYIATGKRAQPSAEDWFSQLAVERPVADVELIRRAWELASRAHAGQSRASGEPYVLHSLAVAQILAELRLDAETIAGAILHDVVEDTSVKLEDVGREFGARVAALVDGVTKMAVIQEYRPGEERGRQEHAQAESLRKMLLAMAEDVRVVLIKLADRLHNMRTLGALPEDKQKRIARETMEVFAPLANRLGIWQIKWELEDLSFRYLEPVAYKQIAALLAEKRVDREQYLDRFVARLSEELRQAGIAAEVTGRPKHIYGIWRKMRRKSKDFAQITDIRGVRVLVDNVRDCYGALGIAHTLWQHIPGEFDDYIATPKENNYRSIHTAVIGPQGKVVEVQIRTHDMHKESELGVAAHWRYKEGTRAEGGFDQKIAWLRTLLAWKDEVAEASEFVDQFKSEVFGERVYVFTPKGKIVDLAAGATPLDFAYHVHTQVGHRCRGARVNGQMVPLTYKLKTGEQVEIITVKEGGPSRDWLSPHLGYLATSKARAKVAHWFREQGFDAAVSAGRDDLERELDRLGLGEVKHELLASRLHFARVEDFLAALGRGEVKPAQIAGALREYVEPVWKKGPPTSVPGAAARAAAAPSGVTVQGVGKLLTRMARCCNPLPGEPIVGFITRGQGVTVHRADCPNAMHHRDEHGERLVQVSWGAAGDRTYPVEVEVVALERTGLLRDITGLLANEKINVLAVNTVTDRDTQIARMRLTLEITDLETLSRVLAQIDRIPNVTEVRRRAK
jgi:GTP pyrophosphokinase